MPDTMTLPEKLVAAAAHPDSWDVRGLLMDAADALVEHCDDLYGEDGILRGDPDDDEDDGIPDDFPVRELDDDEYAERRATCGNCGRSWDDAVVTSMTPAPSGRCPFEAFHQLSNLDNCRREVVPGWTLDEILSREG